MSKFIKYFLCLSLFMNTVVYANYNDIYIADIEYDWIKKSEVEKEAIIKEISDIISKTSFKPKTSLKTDLKTMLKDKEHKKHYLAASAGYKECDKFNISAFYANRGKYIYMYALQDKKDVSKNYYYDALGHLRYVDYIYGEYPEYPYYSYQYKINGNPVSAIYFVSKDTQYLFAPDGSFTGVWYKNNLYDKHSKVILTRTFY